MSREIKFRAWDKKEKVMVSEGFHVFGETTLFNLIGHHCFETKGEGDSLDRYKDIEVMQCTGLKDKNGREIYESDIVHSDNGKTYRIEWVDGCFMYQCKEVGKMNSDGRIYVPHRLQRYLAEQFTIIGNIYDNPELIN